MTEFQTYRDILTSDIIHVRFPDMQSIDAFLHVNPSPSAALRGLAMVFNPTPDAVKDSLGATKHSMPSAEKSQF